MAPGELSAILAELGPLTDPRVLVGTKDNEDAAVVLFPPGKALVQTLDFFTPIVNDPYRFGRIAATNALSDVYVMGGEPVCAMNIVCFPSKTLDLTILRDILRGGRDVLFEAGAALVGGHSVDDPEIKYGLSVTGAVDPSGFATNAGLSPGDRVLLTKPLGTGVLASAIKAKWDGADALEELLYQWAGRSNRLAGEAIRRFGLKAATDVTGFGLGGHLLEMAQASGVRIEIVSQAVPVLPEALTLAGMGLVPVGSHANRNFCAQTVEIADSLAPALRDCLFDAQTSGGAVLAVPKGKRGDVVAFLEDAGESVWEIGRVSGKESSGPTLLFR